MECLKLKIKTTWILSFFIIKKGNTQTCVMKNLRFKKKLKWSKIEWYIMTFSAMTPTWKWNYSLSNKNFMFLNTPWTDDKHDFCKDILLLNHRSNEIHIFYKGRNGKFNRKLRSAFCSVGRWRCGCRRCCINYQINWWNIFRNESLTIECNRRIKNWPYENT